MRIAIIGAGSLRMPLLLRGLTAAARQGTLPISCVVLYDLDEARLALMEAVVSDLVGDPPAPFGLERAATVNDAVRGADFVLSSIRVGGDAARVVDESIPQQFGVLGQETVGPGGFALALRTIPVLRAYAAAMRALAPNAWLLCLTNPAGMIVQALREDGFERVVGVCDTPAALRRALERVAGPDAEALRFQYLGLNHLGWVQHLRVDERDFLQELLVRWETLPAPLRRLPAVSAQQLGVLPGEYLYYYCAPEAVAARIKERCDPRAQTVETMNRLALQELAAARVSGRRGTARRVYESYMARREGTYFELETGSPDPGAHAEAGRGYAETVLSVLVGFHFGVGNGFLAVANGKTIPALAEDDVVEVETEIGLSGPRALGVDEPREPMVGLLRRVKEFERLTVKAAGSGSRLDALRALASHPLVPSRTTARQILDAYLRAHAPLLPQFT